MRFLHTADLHLGRFLDNRPRWDEQAAVLDEIVALAENEGVDLVLLAGDIFDSFIPPAQAEAMFYRFLERLSADGKRAVVAIAGNHDQPQRLAAAGGLTARQGLYLLASPGTYYEEAQPFRNGVYLEKGGKALHLRLANGEQVVVAALPYLSESRMMELFVHDITKEEESRQDYQTCLAGHFAALDAEFSPDTVNLVVAHLFLNGGLSSDSERPLTMQVGGSFGVTAEVFPRQADYIALGHLHRPQQLSHGVPCWYAGSPLAYSFSESDQVKSVILGEISMAGEEKRCNFRPVPLTSGWPLTRWRADNYGEALERCSDPALQNLWVDLSIQLEQPLSAEQIAALHAAHPHLVAITPLYPELEAQKEAEHSAALSILERFALFARENEGVEADEALVQAFASLLNEEEEEA